MIKTVIDANEASKVDSKGVSGDGKVPGTFDLFTGTTDENVNTCNSESGVDKSTIVLNTST